MSNAFVTLFTVHCSGVGVAFIGFTQRLLHVVRQLPIMIVRSVLKTSPLKGMWQVPSSSMSLMGPHMY